MTRELDAKLLAAHATGDKFALVSLYAEAAEATADPARAAFYLTHAWVFALESDDPRAETYRERLAEQGRAD